MDTIQEGTLLWEPSDETVKNSEIHAFLHYLQANKNLHFHNEQELWEWSVTHIEDFWETIWQYFDIQSKTPYEHILTERKMPGDQCLTGATLIYTEHILRIKTDKRNIHIDVFNN